MYKCAWKPPLQSRCLMRLYNPVFFNRSSASAWQGFRLNRPKLPGKKFARVPQFYAVAAIPLFHSILGLALGLFLRVSCRSVTKLDGPRDKKQVRCPMFEPEVFRKQIYCIEESTCDIVGTFRSLPQSFGAPPQWFGASIVIRRPGNCDPLSPPHYAPGFMSNANICEGFAASKYLKKTSIIVWSKLLVSSFAESADAGRNHIWCSEKTLFWFQFVEDGHWHKINFSKICFRSIQNKIWQTIA